jgi:hypothetical protein
MKMPRWIVVAPKSEWRRSADGRSIEFDVRVRKWHPGFWLYAIRYLLGRDR